MPHCWKTQAQAQGALWLSGRVLDSRPRGRGFEPHRRHCVVSLNKNINPSLVLVQPRKTRPFITERLLMGRKESYQTKSSTGSYLNHQILSCLRGERDLFHQNKPNLSYKSSFTGLDIKCGKATLIKDDPPRTGAVNEPH